MRGRSELSRVASIFWKASGLNACVWKSLDLNESFSSCEKVVCEIGILSWKMSARVDASSWGYFPMATERKTFLSTGFHRPLDYVVI